MISEFSYPFTSQQTFEFSFFFLLIVLHNAGVNEYIQKSSDGQTLPDFSCGKYQSRVPDWCHKYMFHLIKMSLYSSNVVSISTSIVCKFWLLHIVAKSRYLSAFLILANLMSI